MRHSRNQRKFIIEVTNTSVKMTIWMILPRPHFMWHMYLTISMISLGFIVRWYEMSLTPMHLSNPKLWEKDRCRIWIQNLEKHNLLAIWREINSNGLVEISGKKKSAIETMLLISERNLCQTTLPLAVKNMSSVFGKLFLHLCQIRNSKMDAV